MKALYYVEWPGTKVRNGYKTLVQAERMAKYDGALFDIRIRYRGRVIARWKNGKRVKKGA